MTIIGSAEFDVRANTQRFERDLDSKVRRAAAKKSIEVPVRVSGLQKFDADLRKLSGSTGVLGQSLGELGRRSTILNAALSGGAAGAAVAGVAALGAAAAGSVLAFTGLAGEIRRFKNLSGATAEEASSFVAVLDDFGISSETGANALFLMGRNASANEKKLRQMGAEIARNADGTVNLTETTLNVADAFAATNDPAKRAQLAMLAFGRQGRELIPILAQGRDGLDKFFESAQQDRQIFSDEDLRKAREFDLAVDNLQDAAGGLARELGSALVPAVTAVADALAGMVRGLGSAGENIDSFLDKTPVLKQLNDAFRALVTQNREFNDFLASGAKGSFNDYLAGLAELESKSAGAADGLSATGDAGEEAADGLNAAAAAAIEAGKAFAQDFAARVEAFTPKFGETFVKESEKASGGSKRAGDAAERLAEVEERGAERIADARRRINETVRENARRSEDSQRRVADAEEDLAERVRDATDRIIEARRDGAQAVEDAERRARDARKSAAERQTSAEARLRKAEEERARAQRKRQEEADVAAGRRPAKTDAEKAAEEQAEEERRLNEDIAEARRELAETLADNNADIIAADEALAEAKEEQARRIAEAQKGLADAQEDGNRRVADAQRDLADAFRESADRAADAQRDLADAQKDAARDIVKAQKDIGEAASGGAKKQELSFASLKRSFIDNAVALQEFASDFATIAKRLEGIADEGIRQKFLGNLRDLARENPRVLKQIANAAPADFNALVQAYGAQSKATVDAAVAEFRELGPAILVEGGQAIEDATTVFGGLKTEFDALADKTGLTANKLGSDVAGIAKVIEATFLASNQKLTDTQRQLLNTALSARDPQEKFQALQRLLDDLKLGGTIPIDADVSKARSAIEDLVDLMRSMGLDTSLIELFLPKPKPKPKRRRLGGPLDAGDVSLVGESGPELFVPNRSGRVVSNTDVLALLRQIVTGTGGGAARSGIQPQASGPVTINVQDSGSPEATARVIMRAMSGGIIS